MSELLSNNDFTTESIQYDTALPIDSVSDYHNSSRSIDSNVIQMAQGNTQLSICVYGNDLRIKNPLRMGNVITFLFVNGHPSIALGPQCNILLYLT